MEEGNDEQGFSKKGISANQLNNIIIGDKLSIGKKL